MVVEGPPSVGIDRGRSGEEAGRPRFWRDALRRRMLALADLLAAAAASLVVTSWGADAFWALVLLPGWVVIAKLIGLYDRDHVAIRHLTVDELPALAAWAAAGVGLLALVLPQTPAGEVQPERRRSAPGSSPRRSVLVLRGAARWAWRRLTPPEVTAVLGDGDLAEMIRRKLELFPDMHLEPRRRARRSRPSTRSRAASTASSSPPTSWSRARSAAWSPCAASARSS